MNNSKSLLFGGVILLFVIVAIPLMSAGSSFSDFGNLFQSNGINLTITINQSESQANLYLNTSGTSFDSQSVSCTDLNIQNICLVSGGGDLSFKISNLINEINGSIRINNGSNYPKFDNLTLSNDLIRISSSTSVNFSSLLDAALKDANIPLTHSSNISEINDYLKQHPFSIASDRNITFKKEGNYYTLWNNEGYGDISKGNLSNIRQAISNGVETITSTNLFGNLTSIMNGIFVGSGDSLNNFLGGVNPNYNISVDTSLVKLEDGTYIVPVTITNGTKNFTSNVTLIIHGLQHATNENTTINENTTEVILDTGSGSVKKIIIPNTLSQDKEITMDMSALMVGSTVTLGNDFTLQRQGTNNYSAILPSGTIITGDSTWDGKLVLPTIVTLTSSSGTVNVAVEMGSTQRLSFSKAVKVILGGMTGKSALYKDSIGEHTIAACSDATADSAGSLSSGECYFDDRTNLIIWTYHFTTFAAYTPAPVSTTSNGVSAYGGHLALPVTTPTNPTPTPINATPAPTTPTKGFFGIITGAIIGALGTTGGIIAAIFIVLVIGAVVAILVTNKSPAKKTKAKKEDEEEEE